MAWKGVTRGLEAIQMVGWLPRAVRLPSASGSGASSCPCARRDGRGSALRVSWLFDSPARLVRSLGSFSVPDLTIHAGGTGGSGCSGISRASEWDARTSVRKNGRLHLLLGSYRLLPGYAQRGCLSNKHGRRRLPPLETVNRLDRERNTRRPAARPYAGYVFTGTATGKLTAKTA